MQFRDPALAPAQAGAFLRQIPKMNQKLRPEDVLVREGFLQLAPLAEDALLVRHRKGLTQIQGLTPEIASRILDQIDGQRDAATLCQDLEPDIPARLTRRLLRGLLGDALGRRSAASPEADGASSPIAKETSTEEPSLPPEGPGEGQEILVWGGAEDARVFARSQGFSWSPAGRSAIPDATRFLILWGEGATYEDLFGAQRLALEHRIPFLPLTADGDGTRLGPLCLPGLTACIACGQIAAFDQVAGSPEGALDLARCFRTGSLTHRPWAEKLLLEETTAFRSGAPPRLSHTTLLATEEGSVRSLPTPRREDCPCCSNLEPATDDGRQSLLEHRAIRLFEGRHKTALRTEDPSRVRTLGIVGGGTAGYLTALAFRRRHPEIEVHLIESSALPIIGVGEATTPLMPQFLHVDLGLDIHSFFRQVEPTFKLGIRFDWGPEDAHRFHYPFGPNRLLEAMDFAGHPDAGSLRSLLMQQNRVPMEGGSDGEPTVSHLDTRVAYHLDNEPFVAYLRSQALALGVHPIDTRIDDVELDETHERVVGLRDEEGRRFAFDFYVDCSGFRSLLLGQALDSPFESFSQSLFTDRAVVGSVARSPDHPFEPQTTARAMEAGWCWNTPQRLEDHRGYVFCSDFLEDEQAEAEMRAKNPGLGATRIVRFRSGRRRHFLRGNVAALGNAYGFVEPLESTALHMLIRQIGSLLSIFPGQPTGRARATLLNRRIGAAWDYLGWFLALHYRFNRAFESPFWNHCRRSTDVDLHRELIEAFEERGPLSYDTSLRSTFDYPDPLWGAEGIDVILLGQGVPCRMPKPQVSAEEWRTYRRHCRRTVARSLNQTEALACLDRDPTLLEAFLDTFRQAGPAFGSSA